MIRDMVEIRDATPEDFELILEGIRETNEIEQIHPERYLNYTPKIRAGIEGKEFRIAVVDGKAAGFIWLKKTTDYFMGIDYVDYEKEYLWINWVYVAPEHRKKGIARELYAEAERFAREHGLDEVMLDVGSKNIGSQGYHESIGFGEIFKIYSKKLSG